MQKPDYGIDSPQIVCGQLGTGLVALALALFKPVFFGFHFRWLEVAFGIYFLHAAFGMIEYSRKGKLRLRETLLDRIPWRGDEMALDVGCGKGLLLTAAARRLNTGKAVGVDLWLAHAISGNSPEAVLRNAELEGVGDRVEVKTGDARDLPFDSRSFDVVVSNFVLHEVDTPADRQKMLEEMVRVLRPGGHLALIDFIFTKECAAVLQRAGMADARRSRIGGLRHWIGAILLLGLFQLCVVTATKRSARKT